MTHRSARFGVRSAMASGSRVIGQVPLTLIHSEMSSRSNEWPCGVDTGSRITSIEKAESTKVDGISMAVVEAAGVCGCVGVRVCGFRARGEDCGRGRA